MSQNVILQVERLQDLLVKAKRKNISMQRQPSAPGNYYDFQGMQADQVKQQIATAIAVIKAEKANLPLLLIEREQNQGSLVRAWNLVDGIEDSFKKQDLLRMLTAVEQLKHMLNMAKKPQIQKIIVQPTQAYNVKVPEEIVKEVNSDLQELERCFNATCYKSCAILCGRILETALHRRYYEETGNDLLEKSPGIGLGNLVAKLSEKNIFDDPGLTQQIHLINQVRIFSVHKKKVSFQPTKNQIQAMILYTIDILNKLFLPRKA